MLFNLLAEEGGASGGFNIWSIVMIVALVLVFGVFIFLMSRRNKKRQKEAEDMINAVKPGNKVKTIGGVCGIVVEVDEAEGTFVLETGSETSGKCYMKFDRQAIYQTDAVAEKTSDKDKGKTADSGEPFEGQTEAQSDTAEQASEQVEGENQSK